MLGILDKLLPEVLALPLLESLQRLIELSIEQVNNFEDFAFEIILKRVKYLERSELEVFISFLEKNWENESFLYRIGEIKPLSFYLASLIQTLQNKSKDLLDKVIYGLLPRLYASLINSSSSLLLPFLLPSSFSYSSPSSSPTSCFPHSTPSSLFLLPLPSALLLLPLHPFSNALPPNLFTLTIWIKNLIKLDKKGMIDVVEALVETLEHFGLIYFYFPVEGTGRKEEGGRREEEGERRKEEVRRSMNEQKKMKGEEDDRREKEGGRWREERREERGKRKEEEGKRDEEQKVEEEGERRREEG